MAVFVVISKPGSFQTHGMNNAANVNLEHDVMECPDHGNIWNHFILITNKHKVKRDMFLEF